MNSRTWAGNTSNSGGNSTGSKRNGAVISGEEIPPRHKAYNGAPVEFLQMRLEVSRSVWRVLG
jgi:hypothetical protein